MAARPLVTNRELEEAIADAPDDEERWIVLEDWLLEQEDPRGAIVQLEKEGRTDDAVRARRKLHRTLLGREHAALEEALYIANWRAGYLRECHYAGNGADTLAALCAAPAAAVLRTLTLSVSAAALPLAMDHVAAGVFGGTLHDLTVSNVHVVAPMLDAAMLAPLVRLRRLSLRGAYVRPARIERIATLVIAPTSYDIEHLAAFLRDVQWPDATQVVLDLGNLGAPDIAPETLAPLLLGRTAPAVVELELRRATPAIAEATSRTLATSPLRPRLRAIRL